MLSLRRFFSNKRYLEEAHADILVIEYYIILLFFFLFFLHFLELLAFLIVIF